MNNYFEKLDRTIKEYFNILSEEIPDFLDDYINTPEMQKQAGINITCGICYSNIFGKRIWYSSLDHSVAVSLIIWHFTKDKKQTLAGLFHDIATPVFKHCVDFMNGDYEKQESTEELTTKIISESKEIINLLNRDKIKIEEIRDYHIYPIADNDTPMLSADRLEYTLSNGMGVRKNLWNLDEIKDIYEDIEIQKNEKGIQELGFKHLKIAEKFVKNMRILSNEYLSKETLLSMQFLADVMKKMYDRELITKDDLYKLSDKEIIEKIEKCNYDNISKCFNLWKNATEIGESDTYIEGKYCRKLKGKMRYIVPLVRHEDEFIKINKISKTADEEIKKAINFKTKEFAYFDFDF